MISATRASADLSAKVSFADARRENETVVFAYVSRRIRPVEEAEDVAAQVFVDAFRSWKRLKGEPKFWLLGIARRKVCDVLRRQKRTQSLSEGDSRSSGMDGLLHAAEVREAILIVMNLPEDQRDAFLLQILEQMSIEEIAQVMGKSHAAVNSLLQRARAGIQTTLARRQQEEVRS